MFRWDDDPDLNITPFVDVMLVLMAILMVTAPTITYQEQITLPKGTRSKKVEKLSTITIRMDKNRRIYLGKETFTLRDFADNFMLKSSKMNKKSDVFIRADESLPYKDVIYLLKSVKEAGFTRVSLLTE
ncbi:biopolymer transporter ExbD [Nitratifractor salsuginis]|uniref:Cell division and transport-associated protein TolR n=1 Tax=Nitratifractor salsuginis (strain DSM 16511 / JCM 12458 / E9I37-1) TaxID=749222 RepID=E6X0D1_NITSE|nr:biopolymer transporter ExbD [Nitratifractor salsuginis]ADV45720.1 Cell division and transport-associated protein TolR [Nitratifractor salsuginis DSM 16511]